MFACFIYSIFLIVPPEISIFLSKSDNKLKLTGAFAGTGVRGESETFIEHPEIPSQGFAFTVESARPGDVM